MWEDILKAKARSLSADDILGALGLERKHTVMDDAIPTGLAFVAGLAAGAGIALLLAPKTGREMRQDLSTRASELTNRIGTTANELAADARNALGVGQQTQTQTPTQPEPLRTPDTTRSLTGSNRTS